MKRPWRRWFLTDSSDVVASLTEQGEVTTRGMEAFLRWSQGQEEAANEVRSSEHEADTARRALLRAIRQTFVTPVNPEDLFELSERLDRLINSAKNLVREAEVLAVTPDKSMADMAEELLAGTKELTEAFKLIAVDTTGATAAAERAISTQRDIERTYRRAMSELLKEAKEGEVREITARRELYRRYARIGDDLEYVADRVVYTVIKGA
ncbi:MAG: DUF47 domain-containing protein [Acidimicrobiales bacterium]|jgi:uncharacterized protein Yka (UPF0111/DUF47 family)